MSPEKQRQGVFDVIRRLLSRQRRPGDAGFDPDQLLEEIPTTEEMGYYLKARAFWTSKEGKAARQGRLLEGPSLARINPFIPLIQACNKVRESLSRADSSLVTEIANSMQLKIPLAEILYENGVISHKSPNWQPFSDWYSRYLPDQDRHIYGGSQFDGRQKSWDEFVLVDLSLGMAYAEFTAATNPTTSNQ